MKNILKLKRDYMEFVGFDSLIDVGTFSILSSKLVIYSFEMPIRSNLESFTITEQRICDDKFMLYEIKRLFNHESEDEFDLEFFELPKNTYISVEDKIRE